MSSSAAGTSDIPDIPDIAGRPDRTASRHPRALPRLLVLTDRTQIGDRSLVEVVAAAVAGGARSVVLREKDLGRDERAALADQIRPIVRDAGGTFIVASDPTIEADGVHLAADEQIPAGCPLVGASAHAGDDLVRYRDVGVAYVTLSPIFASRSKPGYGPALGVDGLRLLVHTASEGGDGPRPVLIYALGGIERPAQAASCLRAGADGVAVMGAVMRAPDPEDVTRRFVDALDGAVAA